jgi:FG-GAP-like repeat
MKIMVHIHAAHWSRIAAVLLAVAAGRAMPQAGVAWVEFSQQPGSLGPGAAAVSDVNTDVDFATGDVDRDGWLDVVVARKQPGSLPGKRTDVLLMNQAGVLTDQTAVYATTSDLPGDLGFLTPCVHTAVNLADVTGDGWLDVIFSASLSDGEPKAISHPRVYRNLGAGGGGAWLGLRHEDGRIPQLLTVGGLAVAPRFAQFDVGDLTGDGAPDLYFVDHDFTETGIGEPPAWDLNDRLLVNDGNGYFVDGSSSSLSVAQLTSAFGRDCQIVELNADGATDIVKLSFVLPPLGLYAFYNNPLNVGTFHASGIQSIGKFDAMLGFSVGNLNNDAIPDLAIADNATDGFQLSTGYDALNKLIPGPKIFFQYVTGADGSYAQNVVLSDLDVNGWNDVLVTDVDADIPGCQRRLHIYHNTGSVPGQLDLVIKEESEFANGGTGPGWKGVVGMSAADEKGTFAVASGDFDLDGDPDLLVGQCDGTSYFRNETLRETCQTDLGFGGPGSAELSLCGDDLTLSGSLATLQLEGAPASQPIVLVLSLTAGAVPFKGGTLVPVPILGLVAGFVTDGAGSFSAAVPGAAGTPVHVFLQALVKDGSAFAISNALDVLMGV